MLVSFAVSNAQSLTLTVDLCDATPSEVRMTGPFWGWDAMGGPIAADNGDGTWTITLDTPSENMEYLWVSDGVQENIIGLGCAPITDGANYANRLWTVGSEDVTTDVYNSCDPCGTPPAETTSVTFRVDMNDYCDEIGFVNFSSSANGWCGACAQMADMGDGVYEIAVDLDEGSTHEYKFTINDWAVQESFSGGESCTSTIDGYVNRTITVGAEDEVLETVCFNSCAACLGTPCTDVTVTWQVDMSVVGANPAGCIHCRRLPRLGCRFESNDRPGRWSLFLHSSSCCQF